MSNAFWTSLVSEGVLQIQYVPNYGSHNPYGENRNIFPFNMIGLISSSLNGVAPNSTH